MIMILQMAMCLDFVCIDYATNQLLFESQINQVIRMYVVEHRTGQSTNWTHTFLHKPLMAASPSIAPVAA